MKKWFLVIAISLPVCVWADSRMYHCEAGLQAGLGYYVGDLTHHIFQNPLDVYGGQFRYKFDKRWALQVKAQRQRISFRENGTTGVLYYNPMWHIDVTAEFNFFRFGQRQYDDRVKPVTPYIFIGVGTSLYNKQATPTKSSTYPLMKEVNVGAYIPFGIGVKWKFADRWQLQAAWQHQIFFMDNIEGLPSADNTHKLNGSNILNNDLTSSLTVGIVFEFAKEKKICLLCQD